jgi:hypothetical protein
MDKLIRITASVAVLAVVVIAAIISYQHACELIRAHGKAGATAWLLPLTVDGPILDASRRGQRTPRLAGYCLGCANWRHHRRQLAYGIGHGPIGALVSAWPALAVVGSYELPMLLIRGQHGSGRDERPDRTVLQPEPILAQGAPLGPNFEQIIRERHHAGHSQRAIARELNMDRRKISNVIGVL